MIMGEHAVVYDYPCIVTAVSERLSVTMEETEDRHITVDAPQVKDTRFVDQAIADGCVAWNIKHHGIHLTTRSNFSTCYGFGSSSAVTVATLFALSQTFRRPVDLRSLFTLAYKTVLSIQGVGSGFDVAAAVYGHTLLYTRGGKTMEPVLWNMEKDGVSLVIGYSGIKADTTTIVKDLAKKRESQQERVDKIFAAIGKLVLQAKEVADKKDWEAFGKFMNFNQEYLRDLGVSTEKLEAMIAAAKHAGAYGAKLSGAGGGDCMIALVPNAKKKAVEQAIREVSTVVSVDVNADGVHRDTTDNQEELFTVVDTDDTVIGTATRYACHHDRTLIHRTVGVLLYDKQGRVLLQKRSMTKDMKPGWWGISAAGHVTHGQTVEAAAHRELREELGIDLSLSFRDKFIVEDDDETEMGYLYTALSDGPFIPNAEEIDQIAFFEPRELQFKVATKELLLTECAKKSLLAAGITV